MRRLGFLARAALYPPRSPITDGSCSDRRPALRCRPILSPRSTGQESRLSLSSSFRVAVHDYASSVSRSVPRARRKCWSTVPSDTRMAAATSRRVRSPT